MRGRSLYLRVLVVVVGGTGSVGNVLDTVTVIMLDCPSLFAASNALVWSVCELFKTRVVSQLNV